jgi:hypothetical protein
LEVDSDYFGYVEKDDEKELDFANLDIQQLTQHRRETDRRQKDILSYLADDYIDNLKEQYDADEKLFDMVEDLLEESQDQDKLMDILDML